MRATDTLGPPRKCSHSCGFGLFGYIISVLSHSDIIQLIFTRLVVLEPFYYVVVMLTTRNPAKGLA